ncbi:DMT family transporter [Halocynthiibacter namhaensis]|uniref:DMT family transporter n=1 Tax=Halocynthiibacter namhaensis TaxID=1290553 RepID=UPI000579317F|nr:DMT family transporter [Halocynthiibacter namhaensis]
MDQNLPKADRPLVGVFWMIVTGLCFVAVTATVKHMDGSLPAAQFAFLRYVLGLIFVIPMIRPMLNADMTRKMFLLFSIRGALQTGGVILWFYAMSQITIAEVTAMNYLSPVYITIGAALFLGEKFAARRLIAVVAALVGALIILRPGVRELSSGHFAMIFTAIFFAAGYLIAKRLSGQVSAAVVIGMLSITVTIGLAPFAWVAWQPMTWEQAAWMLVVAAFATGGHYAMTLAFQAAPVSVTQPVTFLQLVWAVLLGAFVFNEGIDQWVVLGGVIIIAAISYISWREAAAKRRMAREA